MERNVCLTGASGPRARSKWSIRRLAKTLIETGAQDWGLTPYAILVILTIPFLVALIGFGTALMGKQTYKWFTGEDGVAESFQVIFYSLALALSVVVLQFYVRVRHRFTAMLYACLACGFIFLVGEELSWGQRIAGWSTPDTLQQINKQAETNVHNIHGVGKTFKWIQLLVGVYGTLLPLTVWNMRSLGRYRQFLAAVVPPLTLMPYFTLLFVWRIFRNTVPTPQHFYFVISEYNEVMELVLSIGFFMFLVYQLRRLRIRKGTLSTSRSVSRAA